MTSGHLPQLSSLESSIGSTIHHEQYKLSGSGYNDRQEGISRPLTYQTTNADWIQAVESDTAGEYEAAYQQYYQAREWLYIIYAGKPAYQDS